MFPHTNQLFSPQLAYRSIQQPQNQLNNDPIRETSFLDLSNALPADFLAALRDDIEEFESGSGNENIQGRIVQGRREQAEEAAANKMFLNKKLESEKESEEEFDEESVKESNKESDNMSDDKSDEESDEESDDKPDDKSEQNNKARVDLTATCSTVHAREKLVRILNSKAMVPKQRWDIDRILTTLTFHQKNKRLRSLYRKFKKFAFSTLLEESDKSSGQLPGALSWKDWDLIIKLRAKSELEKCYCQKVQNLCRTPCFGAAKTEPGVLDQHPLEEIIGVSSKKAPLFCYLVLSLGPTSCSSSFSSDTHLVSMKIVAVLVILCRLAHQNNSNYFPLLVALYMYFAGAKIDAITLLNHLGLFVSYKVFQNKLYKISLIQKK